MMTKIRKFFRTFPPSIIVLGGVLSSVIFIGFGLAFCVWLITASNLGVFHQRFCFYESCVAAYIAAFSQSLAIVKSTMDLAVAIATTGGIFVALLSYFTAANNGALINHIEHLKIFGEYIDWEINKRDRLSAQAIDRLLLYGMIFDQSRSGKTTVSEGYVEFMQNLNLIIKESNDRCTVGTPGGFSYMDHQNKIRNHMSLVGVDVSFLPRNDFFEMEKQLFSLLQRINQSFCAQKSVPDMVARSYH